jgi:L-fucose isomerase-like protein
MMVSKILVSIRRAASAVIFAASGDSANSRYRMLLARGRFSGLPRDKMAETSSAGPRGYVKMNIKRIDFVNVFNANHPYVVPGDLRESLQTYCELMNISADRVED